jgi:hypothetical protein
MNNVLIISAAILGSLSTYLMSTRLNTSPVFSSTLLSLIFALASPLFFDSTFANQLSLVFFGGSFVGMSNIRIIKNSTEICFAGFLFGPLHLATTHVFKGYGGGLGFEATISVLATIGLLLITDTIKGYYQKVYKS